MKWLNGGQVFIANSIGGLLFNCEMALVAQLCEKGCLVAYEIAYADGCLLVLVTPEGELLLSLPPHLPAGVKTPIRVMLLLRHTDTEPWIYLECGDSLHSVYSFPIL